MKGGGGGGIVTLSLYYYGQNKFQTLFLSVLSLIHSQRPRFPFCTLLEALLPQFVEDGVIISSVGHTSEVFYCL